MIVEGIRYWTAGDAVVQLGIAPERIWDWVRRSKAAGHLARHQGADCPACVPDAFPHVDPPARVGRLGWYVAEQLLAAEEYTGTSTRTGRIRRDA